MISAHMLRGSGHALRENFDMIDAKNLVRFGVYFDQILSLKSTII